MHSRYSISRFIVLRSKGCSLDDASARLRIPRSTLGDWNSRYFLEISRRRASKWEAVETGVSRQCELDLARLLAIVERCETELQRRSLSLMKDSDLIRLLFASRREYFRRRDRLMRPLEQPARCPRDPQHPLAALSGDKSAPCHVNRFQRATASSALKTTVPPIAISASSAVKSTRPSAPLSNTPLQRNDHDVTGPLINTPLQRGESAAPETPNRFNGFPHRPDPAIHSNDSTIDPPSAVKTSNPKPDKSGQKPDDPTPSLGNSNENALSSFEDGLERGNENAPSGFEDGLKRGQPCPPWNLHRNLTYES